MKNKKIIVIVLIACIVLCGGYFLMSKTREDREAKAIQEAAQAARDHKPSGRKFNPLTW